MSTPPLHSPNPELTPDVLVELRAQLEETGRHLADEIASRRRDEGADAPPEDDPETDLRGDEGDQSVDLENWDNTEQVLLDLQTQLANVERALDKFDAGTYGIGELSGLPIPLARLRVVPWARDRVDYEDRLEAR
jgi:RNA polymerase-binding transcription factor DksA